MLTDGIWQIQIRDKGQECQTTAACLHVLIRHLDLSQMAA